DGSLQAESATTARRTGNRQGRMMSGVNVSTGHRCFTVCPMRLPTGTEVEPEGGLRVRKLLAEGSALVAQHGRVGPANHGHRGLRLAHHAKVPDAASKEQILRVRRGAGAVDVAVFLGVK